MTEQHPLTDEMCYQLWQDNKANWIHSQEPSPSTRRVMRATANWQLSQVIEWIENNCSDRNNYSYSFFRAKAFLDDFKKAMRPTTQETNS